MTSSSATVSFARVVAPARAGAGSRARAAAPAATARRPSAIPAARGTILRRAKTSAKILRAVAVGATDADRDALLDALLSTPPERLDDAVDDARTDLTTAFYDRATRRIDELNAAGEGDAADAIDALCARVSALAERSFGSALLPAIASGDDDDDDDDDGDDDASTNEAAGLTKREARELSERWDAITARLAEEGESNALAQAEKNLTSRRDAVRAILGRVPLKAKELRSLNLVTAERRIIDVLLSIPPGRERSDALTDALTPPEDVDDGAGTATGQGGVGQMCLERGDDGESGDVMDAALVGEEEEVFTTPARLLAAVELAMKEARGDDAGEGVGEEEEPGPTLEQLRSLREDVAARCDFL